MKVSTGFRKIHRYLVRDEVITHETPRRSSRGFRRGVTGDLASAFGYEAFAAATLRAASTPCSERTFFTSAWFGLLDEDRTRLVLSWHHSGFSVHNTVTVPAGDGRALEALACYCLRNPVSLTRLRWEPGSETATYLPRAGHDDEQAETLDALDFVARLLAHVPDPRRHLVHYYGAYSNVVRGKQKARGQAQQGASLESGPGVHPPPIPSASVSPSLAALRRGWAQLIRRVYEIDPLVCPRCQGVMRVVAFITEGRVIRRILDHLAVASAPPQANGRRHVSAAVRTKKFRLPLPEERSGTASGTPSAPRLGAGAAAAPAPKPFRAV